MIGEDDYLDRVQMDAHELLLSVPSLVLANHLIDDEGDIAAGIEKKLSTLSVTTGKRGLAIMTLQPTVEVAEKNLPGPVMTVQQEIQVLEHVLFNRGDSGTQIRSSTAALRVLSALHLQTVGPYTWHAVKDPVEPLPVKKGYVSHAVRFTLRLDVPLPAKPAGVAVSNAEGVLTLTCATALAAIHYTTDGSLPRPGGSSSNLYTVPIGTFPTGTLIRAAAYVADQNPGDVLELIIR